MRDGWLNHEDGHSGPRAFVDPRARAHSSDELLFNLTKLSLTLTFTFLTVTAPLLKALNGKAQARGATARDPPDQQSTKRTRYYSRSVNTPRDLLTLHICVKYLTQNRQKVLLWAQLLCVHEPPDGARPSGRCSHFGAAPPELPSPLRCYWTEDFMRLCFLTPHWNSTFDMKEGRPAPRARQKGGKKLPQKWVSIRHKFGGSEKAKGEEALTRGVKRQTASTAFPVRTRSLQDDTDTTLTPRFLVTLDYFWAFGELAPRCKHWRVRLLLLCFAASDERRGFFLPPSGGFERDEWEEAICRSSELESPRVFRRSPDRLQQEEEAPGLGGEGAGAVHGEPGHGRRGRGALSGHGPGSVSAQHRWEAQTRRSTTSPQVPSQNTGSVRAPSQQAKYPNPPAGWDTLTGPSDVCLTRTRVERLGS